MVKVGVITDWKRAARGNAWPRLLSDLKAKPDVTLYPVADLVVEPVGSDSLLSNISKEQVLILNWDVANGDPEFGAHLCQRWLDHRQPEIVEWVGNGGILLVESQTKLGVPSVDAYEALFGQGELPVSAVEDRTSPLYHLSDRQGFVCRKTKYFPAKRAFFHIDDPLRAEIAYTDIPMFPASTTGFLADALADGPQMSALWVGWFRRKLFAPNFRWVSLLETNEPSWRRHSTLKVARVGQGAIFASTMNLSYSKQKRLVAAILDCAGNTDHLPEPTGILILIKRDINIGAKIFGSFIVSYAALRLVPVADLIARKLHSAQLNHDSMRGWLDLALVPALMLLVEAFRRILAACFKLARRFIGY